ncbi:mannose-6-phosphate isomerase, putative [Plasmodium berghei]|uniref:Mannose-6-phosphate isomerase, putative n=2 Tax=Plasmodium berghei TaxID=5821 RepID=A0A509ANG4_PLABA|nr:mannose-6-phosphate isomerase, putative [Plasmodium berghei ANKA]CXI79539.1 mannose-6-phosphate isomerase, putative [Plasmodium berghei]SCM25306.1 mannose-6-phosphate isomerase, putative [Plasmodium berghei]SCN27328.1 mannose-6-phosphate isomerase, putative [Plasmodium berghei]SCO61960.1 mannose-6-phosphate isomerase, putative [Plasmodium berghei]SCO63753.1 mannose-6-phosphate isomerase, putative [Plasmodium berghei]|eukprot:XP_034422962.1 mannose-6-phosphate isomerase, putative [Plasmodium berghei ANKA]
MKTRKLCINECIPYVQKYDWGEGKEGMVYDVMKNIVSDNYEIIKKNINNFEYLKEYAEDIEKDNNNNNSNNNNNDEIEKNENKLKKETIDNTPRYAELWIGNHENGPNLIRYKNGFVKIGEFIDIYKNKKIKNNKISKYFYRNQEGKNKEDSTNDDNSNLNGNNSNVNNSVNNESNSENKRNSIASDIAGNNNKREDNFKRYSDGDCKDISYNNTNESYNSISNKNGHLLKEGFQENNDLFPYLFKMLSINKPLSIQIHPNEAQTLYLNTVNPNVYKDKIFKTEMCVCINSMSLLCGYINIFKISFLIKNIKELYDFFMRKDNNSPDACDNENDIKMDKRENSNESYKRDNKKILLNEESEGKSKNHEPDEYARKKNNNNNNEDSSRDLFTLFDLFDTNKNEHIEKVVNCFSRIYKYIINYSIKRYNEANCDIISIIDNYAECIQKYVFYEDFFRSFYKNENLPKDNINIGNIIKTEKEKLIEFFKQNKNIPDMIDSDVEKYINNIDESEAQNETPESNENNSTMSINNENFFTSMKKIKSLYEHFYKYLTYRIFLAENEVLNKYMISIITKNPKYSSYIKIREKLKKNVDELYIDACKKKNSENLSKEAENYIINNIFEILTNVSKFYPNDNGRIFVFILQLINLKDGDVIYIKPGVMHSYISGNCLECMTNSDLVIRGGLTSKAVDKVNFIKYVNYKNNHPVILEKEFINYNIISCSYKNMKYFKILFVKIRPGEIVNYMFSETSFTSCIILSSNTKTQLKGRKKEKKKASIKSIKKGTIFVIAPNIMVTMSNLYENKEDGDKDFVLYCATA